MSRKQYITIDIAKESRSDLAKIRAGGLEMGLLNGAIVLLLKFPGYGKIPFSREDIRNLASRMTEFAPQGNSVIARMERSLRYGRPDPETGEREISFKMDKNNVLTANEVMIMIHLLRAPGPAPVRDEYGFYQDSPLNVAFCSRLIDLMGSMSFCLSWAPRSRTLCFTASERAEFGNWLEDIAENKWPDWVGRLNARMEE